MLRLKPLNWIDIQQENLSIRCVASTELGFTLEVLRSPKQNIGFWQVASEECGTQRSGECMGPQDGKVMAEEAYLKLILDQLETDNVSQRDHEVSGQASSRDGQGDCRECGRDQAFCICDE